MVKVLYLFLYLIIGPKKVFVKGTTFNFLALALNNLALEVEGSTLKEILLLSHFGFLPSYLDIL